MTASTLATRLDSAASVGATIDSHLRFDSQVRRGFPFETLEFVVQQLTYTGLDQASVYAVVGSATTLQRRRALLCRLSRAESDRLARLVRIVVRAEAILGSGATAAGWLTSAQEAFGNRTPVALLRSDPGTQLVEQQLDRVAHDTAG